MPDDIIDPRKDIKVLLLYPPNQTLKDYMCKPNGSLAYPNLAASLIDYGVEVRIFDACVGNEKDDLNEVFYRSTELPSGLYRTGVSEARILEEAADADIVGLTSIFTAQETMVLATAALIKKNFPEKLIVAGGVNARNRLRQFFAGGVDVVCLSEGELTISKIVDTVRRSRRRGRPDFREVSSVAFSDSGRIVVNPTRPEDVVYDLDKLPIPAWHLLPNERYWKIGRPHGGHFGPGAEFRYVSIMTSMGCPFACSYCHVSQETDAGVSGNIGKFRVKSEERVLAELDVLKRMGIKQIFIEDDSLFGFKQRAVALIKKIKNSGFEMFAMNGLNVIHLLKYEKGRFVPDHDVLSVLTDAGFKEVVVAFESGNQRIIDKYISRKWDVAKSDIAALMKAIRSYGLAVTGNYLLGFPDETREEMGRTVALAREHRGQGMDAANFFCVMPIPGTALFDVAVPAGHLAEDFDPDRMNWTKATMKNTLVPAEEVEELRQRSWRQLNDASWVSYKMGMNVSPTMINGLAPTTPAHAGPASLTKQERQV